MGGVLPQLHVRKSVRASLDRPVSPEARRAILEVVCAAPIAGNQRLYTILDITNQTVKDTLADTCDHQSFIAQTPLVFLLYTDCQKWYDVLAAGSCSPRRPGPGDLWLALFDADIAAQNAITTAWSLGIGSYYIGDVLEQVEIHRTLLRLPEYVVPAALLVSGYSTQQQQEREKLRRRVLKHIVHEGAYRRMEPTELETMLVDNARARPYGTWLDAFRKRKYSPDFSREMSRSMAEYPKSFPPQKHPLPVLARSRGQDCIFQPASVKRGRYQPTGGGDAYESSR